MAFGVYRIRYPANICNYDVCTQHSTPLDQPMYADPLRSLNEQMMRGMGERVEFRIT